MLCVYTYEYVEVMVKKLLEDKKKREREIYQWDGVCIYVPGIFSSCVCVFLLCFLLCFFFSLGVQFGSSLFFWGQSRNLKDFEGPV